ncbi:hypothetical protein Vretifemale_4641 [Volvox reticuliferus]|uniref:Uncharacterized protein n=1 Tax=Volvox reticuliferus TaxID=1737510 RepID=A0A8J4C4X4_9CHLO|nr:hypothetical protein Vretifemale_4641 [Volvox reticuliferus]
MLLLREHIMQPCKSPFCILYYAALLLVLSSVQFTCATVKPPSPFSRLCPRKITSESKWQTCAEQTLKTWNDGTAKVRSSNLAAMMETYAGIVDPNIVVRLEPVGTFVGLDMVAEYETIFASPTGPAMIIRPISYVLRRYVAHRPIAVATVDFLFSNMLNGNAANLTIEQWFRFNEYNRIASADFVLPRYTEFLQALQLDSMLSQDPSIPQSIVASVCNASAAFCSSPGLEHYADFASCAGFLSSIPFMNPLRTQANSVLCRLVHASLVAYAPQIHCSHIGPTGGGVCIDEPYSAYYTSSPFPPATFIS